MNDLFTALAIIIVYKCMGLALIVFSKSIFACLLVGFIGGLSVMGFIMWNVQR